MQGKVSSRHFTRGQKFSPLTQPPISTSAPRFDAYLRSSASFARASSSVESTITVTPRIILIEYGSRPFSSARARNISADARICVDSFSGSEGASPTKLDVPSRAGCHQQRQLQRAWQHNAIQQEIRRLGRAAAFCRFLGQLASNRTDGSHTYLCAEGATPEGPSQLKYFPFCCTVCEYENKVDRER